MHIIQRLFRNKAQQKIVEERLEMLISQVEEACSGKNLDKKTAPKNGKQNPLDQCQNRRTQGYH
ncbi:MAG: hypothetical protein GWO11_03590 [Desulfuromonadales bacterium]|nr:hypothetical protein [Desulfuromonadales bacterium]NIR33529.1 hypothetical protein [Desulfuromonadales bacterium]NIS39703.1 hypothetical protein [Desulfuromonadales bacterium]